jgi:hypothetical protein
MLRYIWVPITIAALLFATIGCSQKGKVGSASQESDSEIGEVIAQLEKLGYYEYMDQNEVEDVKRDSIKAGYAFGWERSGRDFTTDAESLAEGGIGEFYKDVSVFLLRQNVNLEVTNEDFSDKGYSIVVNGTEYEIYSARELESGDIWELSTVRSFSIINKLLKDAGSKEQVYALYGGNDLRAVFLTDEMYDFIKKCKCIPDKEQPEKTAVAFH